MGVYIKSSFSFLLCTFLCSKFSAMEIYYFVIRKNNIIFKECNG